MSGPSTPRSGVAPKSLSDRVLNLKFMQRASASSSPVTPSQAQVSFRSSQPRPSPYSAQDLPLAKRQKLDTIPPISPDTSTLSQETPTSANRSTFLSEGPETEWVLNLPLDESPRTRTSMTGYLSDDEEAEAVWSNKPTGRQIYGAFHRKKITGTTSNETSVSIPTTYTPAPRTTTTSESSPDSGSESGEASEPWPPPISPAPDKRDKKADRLLSQAYSKVSQDADLSRLYSLSGSYQVDPTSASMSNFAGLRGPPGRGAGGGRSKFAKAFAKRGASNNDAASGNANRSTPQSNSNNNKTKKKKRNDT